MPQSYIASLRSYLKTSTRYVLDKKIFERNPGNNIQIIFFSNMLGNIRLSFEQRRHKESGFFHTTKLEINYSSSEIRALVLFFTQLHF